MADPPQMEEPTPTRVEIFPGMCITLLRTKAMTREVVMVQMMMGRDWRPVSRITDRFRPKPRRMTAYCRTFLEQ